MGFSENVKEYSFAVFFSLRFVPPLYYPRAFIGRSSRVKFFQVLFTSSLLPVVRPWFGIGLYFFIHTHTRSTGSVNKMPRRGVVSLAIYIYNLHFSVYRFGSKNPIAGRVKYPCHIRVISVPFPCCFRANPSLFTRYLR